MQLTGELFLIGPTEHISDNFSKREVTLLTDKNERYPQYIQLQMNNSRADVLSQYKVGDQVTVDVNIKGRLTKDETKAFNTLEAWKINKAG